LFIYSQEDKKGTLIAIDIMENDSRSPLKKQLSRFLVVGLSAVITDFTVYFILLTVLPHPPAKILSFIAGTLVAYIFNKYWTFEKPHRSNYELITFFLLYTVTLVANVGVNTLALNLLPQYTLLAFLCATATSTILNFIGQKWWVFRDPD